MGPFDVEEEEKSPFDNLNPLVAQYMKNKMSVADAQKGVDDATKMGLLAKAGDMVSNAGRRPLVLENRMQDLGKAPSMIEQDQQKTDVSGLQQQAAHQLQQARSDESDAVKLAFEQKKAEMMQQLQAQKAAEEQRRFDLNYAQKDRDIKSQAASRQAYADAMMGLKRDQLQSKIDEQVQKKAEAAGELNVPGFNRTGEVTQTKTEAEKARSAIGTADAVKKGIEALQAQMKENGNFEWGGAGGAAMDATATDLRLQLKELANLGVLSGPDYALMLKQIPDTTSLGQLFTRQSTTDGQLNSVMDSLKRKVETSMAAKGYKPQGASSKITVSNGTETLEIDASDLAHAEQDGYKRVK